MFIHKGIIARQRGGGPGLHPLEALIKGSGPIGYWMFQGPVVPNGGAFVPEEISGVHDGFYLADDITERSASKWSDRKSFRWTSDIPDNQARVFTNWNIQPTNMSAELFFKVDGFEAGRQRTLLSRAMFHPTTSQRFPISIFVDDDNQQVQVDLHALNDFDVDIELSGDITHSTWYHLGFSFEANGDTKLYLNGVEVDSGGPLIALPTSNVAESWTIAAEATPFGAGIDVRTWTAGSIHDVALYDKILSLADFQARAALLAAAT